MDAGLRRALRWGLAVSGILGLLCAASMLLVTVSEYGHSGAVANLTMKFPSWAQLGAAPPAAISMLIVGFLSALLLVVGRWPVKVCAGFAAAWFVYAQVTFGSGSPLEQKASVTFDYTPFYRGGIADVVALLAVSVFALVIVWRPAQLVSRPSR